MNILVTGGAGYVGSFAVRLLREAGHEVWVYDNLVYGHRSAVPEGRLIVGDLLDTAGVESVLRDEENRRGDALRGLRLRRRVGDRSRPSTTATTWSAP